MLTWLTFFSTFNSIVFELLIFRDFKIQRRDGNENDALKVNLRSFRLYGNYSYPLILSNVDKPSWNWILRDHIQVQNEKKISSLLVFFFSIKREIRHFNVVFVQKRERNVQKSVMHVQSCCHCLLGLLIFFTFSLPSESLVVWTQINRCVVDDNETHTFNFWKRSSVDRALD